MKRTAGLVPMAIATAALLALGVCAEGADRIKISIPGPTTAFAPLYHAQGAGYFAEEGIDAEVVIVPGAGSLQAVVARDTHFGLVAGTYQLVAAERGQRLPAVMSVLTRNVMNVVMHKDAAQKRGITESTPLMEKIRALKGLKLSGSSPGSLSHQVLVYYLLKAGLDPQKDVEIVGLGTAPALLTALEQRQIDAFAASTPTPEAAIARRFGVMVVDNSAGEDPDFAEFMMDVLVAPVDVLKQQPELVRRVVRALLKSNAWLLDHPAEQAIPFMRPALGRLGDAVILAGLQRTRAGIPRDGRISERAVSLTQAFLRKIGVLKTTIPYDQLVTHDFLPR